MNRAKELLSKISSIDELGPKDVKQSFDRWLKFTGRKEAKSFKDVGGYQLDKQAGGFKIQKIANDSGSVTDISGRMKAKDMISALNFSMSDRQDKK